MLLLLTQAFLEMFVPCCLATASVGTFLSVCSTRCSSFVESCCCAIFFPQQSVVWGKESKGRAWLQRHDDEGFWRDGSFCRAVWQGVVLWCVVIAVMKCGLWMKCFSTDIFMLTWRWSRDTGKGWAVPEAVRSSSVQSCSETGCLWIQLWKSPPYPFIVKQPCLPPLQAAKPHELLQSQPSPPPLSSGITESSRL